MNLILGLALGSAAMRAAAVRRNLLNYTEDLSNAAWVLTNVSGTATRDGATFTFGSNASDRVVQSGKTLTAAAHTVAALLSGTGDVRLYLLGGDGTSGTPSFITLTSTPTLYTLTRTPAGAGSFGGFGVYNGGASPATVTIDDPQLELGSVFTGYQAITGTTFP